MRFLKKYICIFVPLYLFEKQQESSLEVFNNAEISFLVEKQTRKF